MNVQVAQTLLLVVVSLLAFNAEQSFAGEEKMPQTQPSEPQAGAIRLNSREVFYERPREGVRAEGQSFYTRKEGEEKMCYRVIQKESDKMDTMERRFSKDDGKTWSEPEQIVVSKKTPEGTERFGIKAGWVDPVNGRLLFMGGRGVLPSDKPTEAMSRGMLWYFVSNDGGHTFDVEERIIQKGEGYNEDHPFEGVWTGKNAASYGDRTGRPIRTRKGNVLQPLQITIAGERGKLANPGGGFTYTEVAVLIGTWLDNGKIEWQLSQRVANEPDKSSRGALEPTVAELPDGRILMVMRGSDTKTTPGRKWFSLSSDGGFTWSPIAPWTYADGTQFYSPSSCSQLLTHSNGKTYWLGNITPKPPKGNLPRYPFLIGEVDAMTGLLIKSSLTVIDNRQPGEHEGILLSNFMAYEDRKTREILLHMSRPFAKGAGDWTTDAYLYRIEVGK